MGGLGPRRSQFVRDRLRGIRLRNPQAFLTPQFAPAAAMQVDSKDFGFPLSGTPWRITTFVAVLAYSRTMYLEFTLSRKLGSLLRAMQRAMEFFGGVTKADVFDNMQTVVVERHRNQARFHRTFVDLTAHDGFAITACNPRSPHERGASRGESGSFDSAVSLTLTACGPGQTDARRKAPSRGRPRGQSKAFAVEGGVLGPASAHLQPTSSSCTSRCVRVNNPHSSMTPEAASTRTNSNSSTSTTPDSLATLCGPHELEPGEGHLSAFDCGALSAAVGIEGRTLLFRVDRGPGSMRRAY